MSDFVDPLAVGTISATAVDAPVRGAGREALRDAEPLQPLRGVWMGLLNVVFLLAAVPAIVAASILLLLANPFFNPGPLIFRQERVGRDGRVFRIFKFRTMRGTDDATRSVRISANADRITPLGHVLRRYRIDELPNFINVALGEMNVIGPRPDAREQAPKYIREVPGYRDRFKVKPGITGLAQVKQGYADCNVTTRKKARWDRHYVQNPGLKMDLFIIVRTFTVMRTGFGSR